MCQTLENIASQNQTMKKGYDRKIMKGEEIVPEI